MRLVTERICKDGQKIPSGDHGRKQPQKIILQTNADYYRSMTGWTIQQETRREAKESGHLQLTCQST